MPWQWVGPRRPLRALRRSRSGMLRHAGQYPGSGFFASGEKGCNESGPRRRHAHSVTALPLSWVSVKRSFSGKFRICFKKISRISEDIQWYPSISNRGIPGPQKSSFFSIFGVRYRLFSKNVDNFIDVFWEGRWTKVEFWVKSSLRPAKMWWLMILMKIGESADRFAASKVSIMIDSDALLTLVGVIIHGDSERWRNLLIKHHGKRYVQRRCVRHVS